MNKYKVTYTTDMVNYKEEICEEENKASALVKIMRKYPDCHYINIQQCCVACGCELPTESGRMICKECE